MCHTFFNNILCECRFNFISYYFFCNSLCQKRHHFLYVSSFCHHFVIICHHLSSFSSYVKKIIRDYMFWCHHIICHHFVIICHHSRHYVIILRIHNFKYITTRFSISYIFNEYHSYDFMNECVIILCYVFLYYMLQVFIIVNRHQFWIKKFIWKCVNIYG